jgi:hypothetical protein
MLRKNQPLRGRVWLSGRTIAKLLVPLALVWLRAPCQADLQTCVWDGCDNVNWSDTGNWSGAGNRPDDNNDQAYFYNATTYQPTMNLAYTFGQVYFGSSNWTISPGYYTWMNLTNEHNNGVAIQNWGNNNTINAQVRFAQAGQVVYNYDGKTLTLHDIGGSNGCVFSSMNQGNTTNWITLNGDNSVTGVFTVRAGGVLIANNGALGDSTGVVSLGDSLTNAGASVRLLTNGSYTVDKNLRVYYGGNAFTTTIGAAQSSGTSTFSGAIELQQGANLSSTGGSGGTVQFTGLISGSGKTATMTGSGNVKVTPSAAGTTNVNYVAGSGGGGRMLGGSNMSGTVQFTGNITLEKEVTLTAASGGAAEFLTGTWTTNNYAVTVTGAGTSVVKISNTLNTAAAVNVSSGTLRVAGAVGGGGSSLTVAGGARLDGGGTISKPVVVSGTVAPGTSIGTLHVNSTLSLSGTCEFEINPTSMSNDSIDQITMLTYGGTLSVSNVGNLGDFAAGQVFDLFDFGSESGTFDQINLPALGNGLQWKQFDGQPFNYAAGQIQVELGTQATHYGLSANLAVAPNVLRNGYVGATASITCTGSGQMDTLDFSGLVAVSGPGGQVDGAAIGGSDVQHGQTVPNSGLTFHGTEYNKSVVVMPTVVSATNHNIGGSAISDWADGTVVNVGLAQAGPGHDRQVFGPPLVGQGERKKLPGGQNGRDYAGLASKTIPGTWMEQGKTLGTEAIIREGTDSDASHTVSMEWRQRYDGPVGGIPGSELAETVYLCSDVLRLTGMDTDPTPWLDDRHPSDAFALEMSYVDPGHGGDQHSLMYLDLGEDHLVGGVGAEADSWRPAVLGNFGGSPQPPLHMSWDDFRTMHSEPLIELVGYWGWLDDSTGGGRMWAVLDYNNAQFAPEPATMSLLALGGLAVIRRRRK